MGQMAYFRALKQALMWISRRQQLHFHLRLLRHFKVQRLGNILALLSSFFVSRMLGRPLAWGRPWALSVEPSGQCNLQCPECPVGAGVLTRKAGKMPPGLLKELLDQSGPQLSFLNLYFQGEPLLNRQLGEMVQLATERRIFTSMSTNGLLLTPRRCDELILGGLGQLIVSVDGLTPESYARYRKGGDLLKVQEGIRTFLQRRKALKKHSPILCVQFLVFAHNEHEIPALKRWCKAQGVDRLQLKSAQFYDFGNQEVTPPENPRYSRYKVVDGRLEMKGKMYKHCYKQWSSAVVSWDGQVAPCCYDKDLDYSPGNIRQVQLPELWKGKKMRGFRNQVLTNKAQIEMCRNCPEGRKWLI